MNHKNRIKLVGENKKKLRNEVLKRWEQNSSNFEDVVVANEFNARNITTVPITQHHVKYARQRMGLVRWHKKKKRLSKRMKELFDNENGQQKTSWLSITQKIEAISLELQRVKKEILGKVEDQRKILS